MTTIEKFYSHSWSTCLSPCCCLETWHHAHCCHLWNLTATGVFVAVSQSVRLITVRPLNFLLKCAEPLVHTAGVAGSGGFKSWIKNMFQSWIFKFTLITLFTIHTWTYIKHYSFAIVMCNVKQSPWSIHSVYSELHECSPELPSLFLQGQF